MQTPSDEQQAYLDLVDQWRAEVLKTGHKGLCRAIGADKADWRRFRSRKRPPTDLFHARIAVVAKEPWKTVLDQAWDRLEKARKRSLEGRLLATSAA